MLFSSAFVAETGCMAQLRHVGTFPLRGVGQPMEVYAFREQPA